MDRLGYRSLEKPCSESVDTSWTEGWEEKNGILGSKTVEQSLCELTASLLTGKVLNPAYFSS